ncbi:hypothetical protein CH063_04438, partial [Colletotrichum higginsianum]
DELVRHPEPDDAIQQFRVRVVVVFFALFLFFCQGGDKKVVGEFRGSKRCVVEEGKPQLTFFRRRQGVGDRNRQQPVQAGCGCLL